MCVVPRRDSISPDLVRNCGGDLCTCGISWVRLVGNKGRGRVIDIAEEAARPQ